MGVIRLSMLHVERGVWDRYRCLSREGQGVWSCRENKKECREVNGGRKRARRGGEKEQWMADGGQRRQVVSDTSWMRVGEARFDGSCTRVGERRVEERRTGNRRREPAKCRCPREKVCSVATGASGPVPGAGAACKSRATRIWRGLEMAADGLRGPWRFFGCARSPLMMGSGEDTTGQDSA